MIKVVYISRTYKRIFLMACTGFCFCLSYPATSVLIEPNGNSLYQLYEANVNWYEADEVCRRCESGTIVTQHTQTEKDFIVDNLMAGYGW